MDNAEEGTREVGLTQAEAESIIPTPWPRNIDSRADKLRHRLLEASIRYLKKRDQVVHNDPAHAIVYGAATGPNGTTLDDELSDEWFQSISETSRFHREPTDDNDDQSEHESSDDLKRPHAIQSLLLEIVALFIRDFVVSWYGPLTRNDPLMVPKISKLVMKIIDQIQHRFAKIDIVAFLTDDVVTTLGQHWQAYTKAPQTAFPVHPCLESEESEMNYLRQLSSALMLIFVPQNEIALPLSESLLREMLATYVFKLTANTFCDPDYINNYVIYRCDLADANKKQITSASYVYAPTFKKFMEIIKTCDDVEQLKEIRYHVIAEIIQAAHMERCKRLMEKGGSNAKAAMAMLSDNDKMAALSQRNLVRYTNQCALAKLECEKRIVMLGGPNYRFLDKVSNSQSTSSSRGDSQFADNMSSAAKKSKLDREIRLRGTALLESEKVSLMRYHLNYL
jgi:hypothetical protein